MKKLGIIADDLTGANDSGVQLTKKNLSATVVLDFTKEDIQSNSDVVIIDTDSRAKTQKEAYEAVEKAASLLFNKGYQHIYKKVDSTLRGNIAAELSSIEKVYSPNIVVIAPAFPKMKRTTVDGKHYVNGELITETEFGRDPKTPVTESFIPTLLRNTGGKDSALLDLSTLRGSRENIYTFIENTLNDGVNWIVCDSESEEDLMTIAEVFSSLNKKIIWTGSGALVEYLPDQLELVTDTKIQNKDINVDKVLVISGSLSQVTKNQLCEIKNMEEAGFVEIDPVQLVNNTLDAEEIYKQVSKYGAEKYIVVYVDSSEENRLAAKEEGEKLGLSGNEIGERIAKGLGKVADTLLSRISEMNGLVLTGGDIAKAVCIELGIHEMELDSEVEPGLPFGQLRGREKGYWAVTKAGGFGTEQSLVNALHYMTRKVE